MSGLERLAGQRVTVWGLGVFGGGAAAARALAEAGAEVTVCDRKSAAELAPSLEALAGLPLRFELGRDHEARDLLEADLVVKNPAIPPSSPWLGRLRAAGVPLTTELALGLEVLGPDVPLALVTGSKGKTTTVGLLGAMLGEGTLLAGNNERPLLEALRGAGAPRRCVLEVSSFMAEDLALARAAHPLALPRPAAVAFTSLGPEHLNWHGTAEAYYAAKLSLLGLDPVRVVVPMGEPLLAERVPAGPHQRVWAGVDADERADASEGAVFLRDGWAVERGPGDPGAGGDRGPGDRGPGGAATRLFARDALALLGAHNLRNALVAAACARALGAAPEDLAAGVGRFQAVEHRLETVVVAPDGTRFVNDSTATTPEAAEAALEAVPGPVVLLAGGSDKGASYGALGAAAAARAAVTVCLGETGPRLAAAVRAAGGACEEVPAFERAFARALVLCPPGGAVLLSPAAASYDQFANFKARGERFRDLARQAAAARVQPHGASV